MTLSEILYNRSKLTDKLFIGDVIVRDKYGTIKQTETFKSRNERKELQEKLTTLYHDKLTSRQWTISILLE
jgi:hypothetical protein